MQWIAISGSWRKTNQEIEAKVRQTVAEIINNGNGIVTGGALNVDYFATDEAMKCDSSFNKIKIVLPSSLETYAKHYHKRADEGVITKEQAENLITQLAKIRNTNLDSIIEGKFEIIDRVAYFDRITKIIGTADKLIAFQVNNSEGVQDTINKAKQKGIPIELYSFTAE
ncbi:MAG: hypothetical protein Q7S37_02225 [bacterium]|nr:hypothetical protein [bacterium]